MGKRTFFYILQLPPLHILRVWEFYPLTEIFFLKCGHLGCSECGALGTRGASCNFRGSCITQPHPQTLCVSTCCYTWASACLPWLPGKQGSLGAGTAEPLEWLLPCMESDKCLFRLIFEHILRFQDLRKDGQADDNLFKNIGHTWTILEQNTGVFWEKSKKMISWCDIYWVAVLRG